MMIIKIKLKEILVERGISQTDLAKRIGVDKNTISRWTTHSLDRVYLDTLVKLCVELNVTPNDLLVLTDAETD